MPPASTVNWFNVLSFTGANPIQQAINAAAATLRGGVVYIPAGEYAQPSALVVPRSTSSAAITLLGDGSNATVITLTSTTDDILRIENDHTTVQGIAFQGQGSASTAGHGIVLGKPGDSTITHVSITRCAVRKVYSYCLWVRMGDPPVANTPAMFRTLFCSYTDCEFSENQADAAVFIDRYNTTHYFRGCEIAHYKGTGLKLVGAEGVSFIDGAIEGPLAALGAYLYANNSLNCNVVNCWFEDGGPPAPTLQWFVFLENYCNAWTISGCTFRRLNGLVPQAIGIGNELGACRGIAIINPQLAVTTPGTLASTNHIVFNNVDSECYLIGGYLEQKLPSPPGGLSYKPIAVGDVSQRSMIFGGTQRVRVARLWDGEITSLPNPQVGEVAFNLNSNRLNVYTPSGWVGLTTGPR